MLKKSALALSLLVCTASHAFADDYSILKPAVEETQRDVADLVSVAQGLGDGLGDPSPGPNPTPNPGTPGCSFCDESGAVEEGDVNQALGILQEVASSLVNAMDHILALPSSTGQAYNFNKSFACSYTGDAAIDIGSASLALGYPQNLNVQWKTKENSSVTRLKRARGLANCP